MSTLAYILLFTFLGSIVSLIGGILLLFKEKFALKISHFLAAFAAGTLLGTAFLDLLPEAHASLDPTEEIFKIFFWALLGVLVFFLLERFIHHHGHGSTPEAKRSVVPLIVVGDSVHNFVDGVAIAATFLINVPLGIVTSLAVAAHEIPQEIGDFGLLLNKGVDKGRVLKINLLSSGAALVGAVLTYMGRDSIEGLLPQVLALTAGFFIYIALANLIPEIHSRENQKVAFWETVMLFVGVLVVYFAITSLEGIQ